MQMKLRWPNTLAEFSPAAIRRMVLLALASLASGLFIKLTWELKEDVALSRIDESLLAFIGKLRWQPLNGPAVDVTAMGSATLVFIFGLTGVLVLWLARDRKGAAFLISSVAGAGVWSSMIKFLVRRERPTVIERLVEVSNFSYLSGHTILSTALFLALALLASRYFKDWRVRLAVFSMAFLLIGLVGFSRLYLGVHYPSDVASGIFLGIAWTLGLAAIFFSSRGSSRA